ncbi:hypothetical protein [Streptomyces sp. Amel2xC10]|uniref:hypothetical protein n=1 Tax=Streptomyces sp. Amel2xC10 TaxID=1305826 RepID=UPI000A082E34|nr:hypothetical protein [Streptomyces sp. Amel2xC10]SME91477.1 hypothetical protein SAMN02745830_00416 [Streptomyces sp. Amel2xC10]
MARTPAGATFTRLRGTTRCRIQETPLIPLYARAVETRERRPMLRDPRAVEMVESPDYGFSRFDGARGPVGADPRILLFPAPGARLALETAGARMVGGQDRHDVLARMAARIRRRCDDPADVAARRPGIALTTSRTSSTLPAPVRDRLPAGYRRVPPAAARPVRRPPSTLRRRDIDAYRFRVFRVDGRPVPYGRAGGPRPARRPGPDR